MGSTYVPLWELEQLKVIQLVSEYPKKAEGVLVGAVAIQQLQTLFEMCPDGMVVKLQPRHLHEKLHAQYTGHLHKPALDRQLAQPIQQMIAYYQHCHVLILGQLIVEVG